MTITSLVWKEMSNSLGAPLSACKHAVIICLYTDDIILCIYIVQTPWNFKKLLTSNIC